MLQTEREAAPKKEAMGWSCYPSMMQEQDNI